MKGYLTVTFLGSMVTIWNADLETVGPLLNGLKFFLIRLKLTLM